MRTITFVALQCFQCSTMQVKQQKKSCNKWTCVVCNQKQSVRKVFAQGLIAKDLRLFVQSFNMSRKVADERHSPDPETSMPTLQLQGGEDGVRKRRSDWTEYLDVDPDDKDKDEGCDLGPRVLTELPEELFKKPKLKDYASEINSLNNGGDGMLYKPCFSKRSNGRGVVKSLEKEAREVETREANAASKWNRNEREIETCETTVVAKASKWSSYISKDDDEEWKVGSGRNSGDKKSEFRGNDDAWETLMEDYKVEDDVHPDFM